MFALLSTKSKKQLGFIEGWSSVFINTALFGFKLWAGQRLNSVAMKADAWHTLSDTLTSVVVIIGFWQAGRPADEKHSFGHGRAEAIASIIIGTLLGVVGFAFLRDSIIRLVRHEAVAFQFFAVIIFLVSALVKEALAQFSLWAGRRTKSEVLVADAWHHRSDAVASALIVIGAVFGRRLWWMDGVLGIGVSLLILSATLSIIKTSASVLMGESPSRDLQDKIQRTVRDTGAKKTIHHLHVHSYGDHTEVTAHLHLPGDMKVGEAHAIVEKIENTLRDQLNLETTIHVDPVGEKPCPGDRAHQRRLKKKPRPPKKA